MRKFILIFYFLFTIVNSSLLIFNAEAQCNLGFDPKLSHYCPNLDSVSLVAWDSNETGGCLYMPGFIINITLGTNPANEDILTIYENGKVLGSYNAANYAPFPMKILGWYLSSISVYSFTFCDKTKNGTFPYTVYDRNHMKLIASGIILGSDSCTTITLPKLTGTARFSGPGITNYNDGYGKFDPAAVGAGIYNIQYYWNDGMGFVDSVSQSVTVNPDPAITLNPIPLCPDSSGVMTASAKGARKYKWSTNDTTQSIIVPPVDSSYTVTIIDSNACFASKTASVKVLTPPANFLKPDTTLCNLNSILLKPAQNFDTYKWQDGSELSSITVSAQGTYKLTVTDMDHCPGVDSISVINECPPVIYTPNAFTPGDKNIDNKFYAYGNNITSFRMDIFNKWGTHVFYSENINTPWDGTYNNDLCPFGVYVYIIHYEGLVNGKTESNIKKGTFALLR